MTGTAQQQRAYTGPRILERGFWPFFLSAGLMAGLAMPVWAAMHARGFSLASNLGGREWHVHEMLFGYLAAVVAGFLLTAIPNWTGRLPVIGIRLGLLWALWLAGRLATGLSNFAPLTAAVVDSAFLVVFASLIWREVLSGNNIRNGPVCALVSLLAIANIMFHYAWLAGDETRFWEHLALAAIAILISLIGGRIVPSFTLNWMMRRGETVRPVPFGRYDAITLLITLITLLTWTFVAGGVVTGGLFALTALLHAVRLARWAGHRTAEEPLLFILHVGYAWLPLGYGLLAAAMFGELLPETTALHALTAGAIGTMIAAVMSRATLGHTGRPLHAGPGTVVAYGLIVIGAFVRVLASAFPDQYGAWVLAAGGLWAGGYMLFALIYGPMLLRPPATA